MQFTQEGSLTLQVHSKSIFLTIESSTPISLVPDLQKIVQCLKFKFRMTKKSAMKILLKDSPAMIVITRASLVPTGNKSDELFQSPLNCYLHGDIARVFPKTMTIEDGMVVKFAGPGLVDYFPLTFAESFRFFDIDIKGAYVFERVFIRAKIHHGDDHEKKDCHLDLEHGLSEEIPEINKVAMEGQQCQEISTEAGTFHPMIDDSYSGPPSNLSEEVYKLRQEKEKQVEKLETEIEEMKKVMEEMKQEMKSLKQRPKLFDEENQTDCSFVASKEMSIQVNEQPVSQVINAYQQTDISSLGKTIWPVIKKPRREDTIPSHEQLIQEMSRSIITETNSEENSLLVSGIWGKVNTVLDDIRDTNNMMKLALAPNDSLTEKMMTQSIEILRKSLLQKNLHLMKPKVYQRLKSGEGIFDERFTSFMMKTMLVFPIKDSIQGKLTWSLLILVHVKDERESYLKTKKLESSFKVYILDPLFQPNQKIERKSDCVFSYINYLAQKKVAPKESFRFERHNYTINEELIQVPTSTRANSGLHVLQILKSIVTDSEKFHKEIKQRGGYGRNRSAFESEMRKDVFRELYLLSN